MPGCVTEHALAYLRQFTLLILFFIDHAPVLPHDTFVVPATRLIHYPYGEKQSKSKVMVSIAFELHNSIADLPLTRNTRINAKDLSPCQIHIEPIADVESKSASADRKRGSARSRHNATGVLTCDADEVLAIWTRYPYDSYDVASTRRQDERGNASEEPLINYVSYNPRNPRHQQLKVLFRTSVQM